MKKKSFSKKKEKSVQQRIRKQKNQMETLEFKMH